MSNKNSSTEKKAVSKQELDNSAIGTWSGYIYQGLCGVLVVLRMLVENEDKYADYALQLDGYEDFTILDSQRKIVSLHQCKSVKGKTDYNDEFDKMMTKLTTLSDKLHDPDATKCYFHCNRVVPIDTKYQIESYPFKAGESFCGPGDIRDLIIAEIEHLKVAEADSDTIYARMDSLINKRVLEIQDKSFHSNKPLKEIARDWSETIKFKDFINILNTVHFTLSKDEVLASIRNEYIASLQQKIEKETYYDTTAVESFVEMFCNLNQQELRAFMQRINPKDKLEDTFRCYKSYTDSTRINLLYRLLLEVPITDPQLHWRTNNYLQTPTTLGNDEEPSEISREIYKNRANFDAAWIYDWFVGRIDKQVDNIRIWAGDINDVEDSETDKHNIFRTKNVGILTIDDKKSGNYD